MGGGLSQLQALGCILDCVARNDLVRYFDRMNENAFDPALRVCNRLIDEVEITFFGLSALGAIEPRLHFATKVRLARSVNLVKEVDKRLRLDLRQAFPDRLANEVRSAFPSSNVQVLVIYINPAMFRPRHEADGGRRLRQQFLQPVSFALRLRPQTRFSLRAFAPEIRHLDVGGYACGKF